MRRAVVPVIDKKGKIITLKQNCKCSIPLELAKNITEDDSKLTAVADADITQKSMV